MEITAFIMGICHPIRLDWLQKNLVFTDAQEFPFVRKIVAVDQFSGYTLPKQLREEFVECGWEVIIDNHHSRPKTMDHILNIDTEYMFYNEDDVLPIFPDFEDLNTVFNLDNAGRKCGMISLTVGGSDWIIDKNIYGDIVLLNDNILLENERYVFFKRIEEYKNNFFFEFPGLFIRTELFKQCHLTAKENKGTTIEMGLSDAYFQNDIDKNFYKCSVTKSNFLEVLLKDVPTAMTNCRMLHNLDVNQGSALVGGVHYPSAHSY